MPSLVTRSPHATMVRAAPATAASTVVTSNPVATRRPARPAWPAIPGGRATAC